MGIGSDYVSSLTGNIDQAILEIHDFRKKKTITPDQQRDMTVFMLKEGEESVPVYAGDFPSRFYKVQFNPAQLMLNCTAHQKTTTDTQSQSARNDSAEIPTLVLSLRLYFDDMFTYDAFLWDRFNSEKGLAALTAQKTLRKEKEFSVQEDVESFIAALRDAKTRCVSFRWADFVFHGQLNYIQAKYTMFSPSGNPIRAEVSMRIRSEMDESAILDYYEYYAKIFTGTGAARQLASDAQGMEALLNVDL